MIAKAKVIISAFFILGFHSHDLGSLFSPILFRIVGKPVFLRLNHPYRGASLAAGKQDPGKEKEECKENFLDHDLLIFLNYITRS